MSEKKNGSRHVTFNLEVVHLIFWMFTPSPLFSPLSQVSEYCAITIFADADLGIKSETK